MKAEAVVKSMHVVNDAAERGVKLGSDFLDCAKIEEHYQDILQVAENDRHRVPNQRSRKAVSKSWYLTLRCYIVYQKTMNTIFSIVISAKFI